MVLAALVVILLGAGLWSFTLWNKAPRNQEGDLATFIDDCFVDLSGRRALFVENTAAQLKGACKCFGTEFYPLVQGKSREDAVAWSRQPDALRRARTIRRKCAQQVGLDGVEEWWY